MGLWRARVLEIDWPSETPPRGGRGGWTRAASLRVVVGDDAGAEAEVEVPMRRAYDRLRAGEPALLLVVSSTPSMKRFRCGGCTVVGAAGEWRWLAADTVAGPPLQCCQGRLLASVARVAGGLPFHRQGGIPERPGELGARVKGKRLC